MQVGAFIPKATAAHWYTPMHIGAWQRLLPHDPLPPKWLWITAAHEEAADGGVDPEDVLGGYKGHAVCRARWRAWKRILDLPDGYSARGLAKVCGWSSSDISYGVRRVGGLFVSAIWHGPARKLKPYAPSRL